MKLRDNLDTINIMFNEINIIARSSITFCTYIFISNNGIKSYKYIHLVNNACAYYFSVGGKNQEVQLYIVYIVNRPNI